MTPRVLLVPAAALIIAALAGCGRAPTAPQDEKPPSSAATQMRMGASVIRIVDPDGEWKFEAHSDDIEAENLEGPYQLHPASCWYWPKGRPPVEMKADRARLDKAAQRILLEGNVRITCENWSLAAERVEYDLGEGKVVASGRTKWKYQEKQSGGPAPPADEEKP